VSPRIAIDGRELREGVRTGIRRYTLEVLRAAVGRGLTCVLYGDRRTQLDAAPEGVTRVVVGAAPTAWWDQMALPGVLRRDAIDVFLSPYYKRPLVTPCPAVITIHDLFFIGYPGRRRPVYDAVMTAAARLYARGAAAIIADSGHSRDAIVARLGIPAERIAVIPVGLGSEFRPTTPTPTQRERYNLGRAYVLYVGNFLPHKNLPRLLRAWAALPEPLRRGHRLVLAGAATAGRDELATQASALGLGQELVFAGRVEDRDLPALYGGASLLVLPSLEEGFGLPALEGMACGAPIVATRRGAVPEVVGDAGVLVDPEDERALAGALHRVLAGDLDRATLRRASLARAADFTAERTAGRVIDLLLATAGARPVLARRAG